jgi:ankyrin repeat protein
MALFLANKQGVNSPVNRQGETALHVAVRRHNLDLVEGLLAAGADKSIKTSCGFTAQDYAEKGGFPDVYKKLSRKELEASDSPRRFPGFGEYSKTDAKWTIKLAAGQSEREAGVVAK